MLFARRNDDGTWALRYVWADEHWATGPKNAAEVARVGRRAVGAKQATPMLFAVPVASSKGFQAELSIALAPWA